MSYGMNYAESPLLSAQRNYESAKRTYDRIAADIAAGNYARYGTRGGAQITLYRAKRNMDIWQKRLKKAGGLSGINNMALGEIQEMTAIVPNSMRDPNHPTNLIPAGYEDWFLPGEWGFIVEITGVPEAENIRLQEIGQELKFGHRFNVPELAHRYFDGVYSILMPGYEWNATLNKIVSIGGSDSETVPVSFAGGNIMKYAALAMGAYVLFGMAGKGRR